MRPRRQRQHFQRQGVLVIGGLDALPVQMIGDDAHGSLAFDLDVQRHVVFKGFTGLQPGHGDDGRQRGDGEADALRTGLAAFIGDGDIERGLSRRQVGRFQHQRTRRALLIFDRLAVEREGDLGHGRLAGAYIYAHLGAVFQRLPLFQPANGEGGRQVGDGESALDSRGCAAFVHHLDGQCVFAGGEVERVYGQDRRGRWQGDWRRVVQRVAGFRGSCLPGDAERYGERFGQRLGRDFRHKCHGRGQGGDFELKRCAACLAVFIGGVHRQGVRTGRERLRVEREGVGRFGSGGGLLAIQQEIHAGDRIIGHDIGHDLRWCFDRAFDWLDTHDRHRHRGADFGGVGLCLAFLGVHRQPNIIDGAIGRQIKRLNDDFILSA